MSPSSAFGTSVLAVREFVERAQLISQAEWIVPRAAGKWSPCEEAQHLTLSFRFFAEAILGRRVLALEVTPERSAALYAAVIPKLREGHPLPIGARSPAAADPAKVPRPASADRDSVLRDLISAAQTFHVAVAAAAATEMPARVQHPYFGFLDLEEFEIVAAAHTRHHMAFLPGDAIVNERRRST